MNPVQISHNLASVLETALPRILTQACRDTGNPAYGCFDRNWWHYRIRDFASIILQQGGYTVYTAAKVCNPRLVPADFASKIAAGSCRFWNTRAIRHGAFEEYYPWEQGYPPLAFSTLAVAKLVAEGVVQEQDVHNGLAIAARQLANRFESKAANQQIAGLAALAWVKKIAPALVSGETFATQKRKSLALQTDEGWFWEYDGPDIGYLSVTLDCLWDLYDATGDQDFRTSADSALGFIARVMDMSGCGLGMLNARNTDYVVPYGIARHLADGPPAQREQAAFILDALYTDTEKPTHFFKAVDDRYWCHYIGHSVARAIAVINCCGEVNTQPRAQEAGEIDMPLAGYVFKRTDGGTVITLALNKGGCVRLTKDDKLAFDFGWVLDTGKKQFVTHWWSRDWELHKSDKVDTWTVRGHLVPHKETTSTPFMHIALRIVSLIFGKTIIGLLKNVMIFKKTKSQYSFHRTITATATGVSIHDEIEGLNGKEKITSAPRASKRHVASADSFSTEDFELNNGFDIKRSQNKSQESAKFIVTTLIRLAEKESVK